MVPRNRKESSKPRKGNIKLSPIHTLNKNQKKKIIINKSMAREKEKQDRGFEMKRKRKMTPFFLCCAWIMQFITR